MAVPKRAVKALKGLVYGQVWEMIIVRLLLKNGMEASDGEKDVVKRIDPEVETQSGNCILPNVVHCGSSSHTYAAASPIL